MNNAVRLLILALVLTVVGLICYGPYLNTYFACDDFKYLENIISRSPVAISLGYNAQMRLLSNWAWVPLYWISGTEPLAYNTFGLCVNLGNALLLYHVLKKLLKNEFVASMAPLFFVMNAAAADAVFWKANFSGLLSLFFSLLSLSLYVDYRLRQSLRLYWLSVAVYVLAIFSKEDATALIALLVIVEFLYLDGLSRIRPLLLRVAPYVLAVVFYLAVTTLAYRYYHLTSETWGWFRLRPLYLLFGGFSAFFINPDGLLSMQDVRIYITALLIPLSFLLVKDRKVLLLGFLWIIVTFAPSSLTSIGVFDPRSFTSSTSRFYYAPAAGVAIVLAACLDQVRVWTGRQKGYAIAVLFCAGYLALNVPRIHARGDAWSHSAEHARSFTAAMKQLAPTVPAGSYMVLDTQYKPVGWMWQALNVAYLTSGIQGGRSYPATIRPDQPVFLVRCDPSTVLPYQVARIR
ncbi:hypothetical protein [Geomonas anaerohicana]|uniref:Glycosyltransferase RgtA/B/C/D-like domain-containing protein n=1 Tax=Geomonas anaerohicana TaxID=2798583 RepID=A0ABS0YAE7_9BACT|nr:hypothetical protein [Geomonas anaerohicana]MBJ6749272.1 hypothetical protein [Geomonas anaerohicana]